MRLIEIRLLDGPNLYRLEPAIKLEVAIGRRRTWYGKREPEPHQLVRLAAAVPRSAQPPRIRALADWVRELRRANPFPNVKLEEARYGSASPAVRIVTDIMPDSVDVAHHPFQDEIDELVDAVRRRRETSISVFDAQKTMEACLAADLSAAKGGRPVKLPLIR